MIIIEKTLANIYILEPKKEQYSIFILNLRTLSTIIHYVSKFSTIHNIAFEKSQYLIALLTVDILVAGLCITVSPFRTF